MKPKFSLLALVAITALLHAAPPPASAPSPEQVAKDKVATEIHAKVTLWRGGSRFSRALPTPSHRLEFQPPMLADGEKRLPFTIIGRAAPKAPAEWQGYVRLSDQEIFLLDPKTGKHRPAKEHPRFAPAPKVEPSKPL